MNRFEKRRAVAMKIDKRKRAGEVKQLARDAKPGSAELWKYMQAHPGDLRLDHATRDALRRVGLVGLKLEAAITHLCHAHAGATVTSGPDGVLVVRLVPKS